MNKKSILGLLSAAIIFTLMISLGASVPTQTLTDGNFFSESRRQLTFRFVLSEDAREYASQIITKVNDDIGELVLESLPFAYVVFSDGSMARDRNGIIIGDGLSLRVTLYLLVRDVEMSGSGLTLLNLASFNTNPDIIQYFVDADLVELDEGMTASDLASQVEMESEIKYDEDTVVVKDDWDAMGFHGEIKLSMKFTRQEPSYVPVDESLGHYLENYIGMRFRSNPSQLFGFSKRATTYIADLQEINISFDLENSEISAIFSDKGNIIDRVTEEQSEILLEQLGQS